MKTFLLISYLLIQILTMLVVPLDFNLTPDSLVTRSFYPFKKILQSLNFTQSWSFYTPVYFQIPKYEITVINSSDKARIEIFPSLGPRQVDSYFDLKKFEVLRYLASYPTDYYLLAIKGYVCKKHKDASKVIVKGKIEVLPDTGHKYLNNYKRIVRKNIETVHEEFLCRN